MANARRNSRISNTNDKNINQRHTNNDKKNGIISLRLESTNRMLELIPSNRNPQILDPKNSEGEDEENPLHSLFPDNNQSADTSEMDENIPSNGHDTLENFPSIKKVKKERKREDEEEKNSTNKIIEGCSCHIESHYHLLLPPLVVAADNNPTTKSEIWNMESSVRNVLAGTGFLSILTLILISSFSYHHGASSSLWTAVLLLPPGKIATNPTTTTTTTTTTLLISIQSISKYVQSKVLPTAWQALEKMILMEAWRQFWIVAWDGLSSSFFSSSDFNMQWISRIWNRLPLWMAHGTKKIFQKMIQNKLERPIRQWIYGN